MTPGTNHTLNGHGGVLLEACTEEDASDPYVALMHPCD